MPGIENCPGTLPRLLRHGKWSPAGVQRAVLTPKPAGNERLWNIRKVGTRDQPSLRSPIFSVWGKIDHLRLNTWAEEAEWGIIPGRSLMRLLSRAIVG